MFLFTEKEERNMAQVLEKPMGKFGFGKGLVTPVIAIVAFILVGAIGVLSGLSKTWKLLSGIVLIVVAQYLLKGFFRMVLRVFGVAFIVMAVVEYTGIIAPTGSVHIGLGGLGRAKGARRYGAGF